MPAEFLFDAFVAALVEALEYGMKGASPLCKRRVATLRTESEQGPSGSRRLRLRRHFNKVAEHPRAPVKKQNTTHHASRSQSGKPTGGL